jgi:hypothetical protein
LGVSYLVCLGRDLWKELIAVVEGETWAAAPTAVEPAGEAEGEPEIDEAPSEDLEDADDLGYPRMSVRPETRHRRWAALWDEDAVWGDPDPATRRRLKRLLGGA